MAHDRLNFVSVFRSGVGPVFIPNDTLGPIGPKSAWLMEHLEMALGNYNVQPEEQHEILHHIRNMPWTDPNGLPLNTLRILLVRVNKIADSLDASWFEDYSGLNGSELFVVSLALVRT